MKNNIQDLLSKLSVQDNELKELKKKFKEKEHEAHIAMAEVSKIKRLASKNPEL